MDRYRVNITVTFEVTDFNEVRFKVNDLMERTIYSSQRSMNPIRELIVENISMTKVVHDEEEKT